MPVFWSMRINLNCNPFLSADLPTYNQVMASAPDSDDEIKEKVDALSIDELESKDSIPPTPEPTQEPQPTQNVASASGDAPVEEKAVEQQATEEIPVVKGI